MSKSVQDLTDGQLDAYNESRRISHRETRRRLNAWNAAIKAELEDARRRRLIVRPDAFGRTEDEIVCTFTRETLYGEQPTAAELGTITARTAVGLARKRKAKFHYGLRRR